MNYTTTISLTPNDNNRFQAVYASQRYGTFFGIFAKFQIEEKGNDTLLHRIDLELINYKGLLNLSFEDIQIDPDALEKKRNLPVILLKINVIAKIGEIVTDSSVTPEKPIVIQPESFLSVVTETLPLSGSDEKKEAFVHGVFDDEYFFRDGLVVEPRKVTEIDLKTDIPGKGELGFDFQSVLMPQPNRFSSIRCRVGNSKIVTS